MMRSLLFMLCVTVFITCNNDGDSSTNMCGESIFDDNKEFTVNGYGCLAIYYHDRIGDDFNSALDELSRMYEQVNFYFSNVTIEKYETEKKQIDVNFTCDNREFTLVTFNVYSTAWQYVDYLPVAGGVIDENGNYYGCIMPPD